MSYVVLICHSVCMISLFVFCQYMLLCCFFFFKQKTAYEMRISDWSSDVCSSDLMIEVDVAARRIHLDVSDAEMDRRRTARATFANPYDRGYSKQIGRASCRERVCQYV